MHSVGIDKTIPQTSHGKEPTIKDKFLIFIQRDRDYLLLGSIELESALLPYMKNFEKMNELICNSLHFHI